METVEVVIKIPEILKTNIDNGHFWGSATIFEAIQRGTIIPKGHGKLIDVDRTLKNTEEIYNASNIKDIINPAQMYDTRKILTNAPAIIE